LLLQTWKIKMANYSDRGIALTFSGDLQISANGDIDLANSFETQKAAVNWFLRTNKGDYTPDRRLGCNLGTFIGKNISAEVLDQMESVCNMTLTKYSVHKADLRIDAIPIDHDNIGLFVSVGGRYLDEDGNLLASGVEILKYIYPYLEGQPTPLP
jgi:phage baseplate assembly protein W